MESFIYETIGNDDFAGLRDAVLGDPAFINFRTRDGNTLLHLLIFSRPEHNDFIAKLLIRRGADVNAINFEGQTPVMTWLMNVNDISIFTSDPEIPVDLGASDNNNTNVYHYMSTIGSFHKILMSPHNNPRVDINQQTFAEGYTPLMSIISGINPSMGELELYVIGSLIETMFRHTDVNISILNWRGENALQLFESIVGRRNTENAELVRIHRILQAKVANYRGPRPQQANKFTAAEDNLIYQLEKLDLDGHALKLAVRRVIKEYIRAHGGMSMVLFDAFLEEGELFEDALIHNKNMFNEHQQNLIEHIFMGGLRTFRICGMCHDDDEPADTVAKCGHPFHQGCIDQYMRSGLSRAAGGVCPVCNRPGAL